MNEAQQYTLKKNILATLLYYDVSSLALTAIELFRFCIDRNYLSGKNLEVLEMKNIRFFDFLIQLEVLEKEGYVRKEKGLYVLSQSTTSISRYAQLRKESALILFRAYSWLRWLRYVPFVRTIFITGGLSFRNAHKGSDWDVLVISQKNRIFSARFFMTVITQILAKRRYGKYVRDRICLNHYMSEKNLAVRMRDLFSAREYAWAIPVGYTPLREQFYTANAIFIKKFLPFWKEPVSNHFFEEEENDFLRKIQKFLEGILSWNEVEKRLKTLQIKKIRKNPIVLGGYIVTDDEALIFLPNPHGPKVYEEFLEKRKEMRV
jgi:hypothetical protein